MNEPTYHLSHVVKSKNAEPEDFSGPLDVILLLLSKNKIEIRDIQISVILEQYLEYLDEMKRMALEQRQRQEIMEKLKEPVAFLERRNDIGRNLFTKQPEPLRRDQTYRYQHDREDLRRALQGLGERSEARLPSPMAAFAGIVGKEPYPVEKKSAEILKRLIAKGAQRLRSLFRGNRSRSEVVATFLSILELCKLRSIQVTEENGDLQVNYLHMPEESEVQE